MTTTFLLIRHAAPDNVGDYLAGRMAGVCLGETDRAQAFEVARVEMSSAPGNSAGRTRGESIGFPDEISSFDT
ncbi:hypothetical protein [Mesorhizobium delmotii]|uniref:Histidine phosphatase family protein n=1 Tax=Mesorhizobium delmotii TaxID=1631247 RepID=A0A2P9AKV2_9HYPH|nr:hypothetical protein BQ8482_210010 [Mesorhizobium delmotii]